MGVISFVNIISETLVFNINLILISIIDLVVIKTMVVFNHVPGSTSLQYVHALTCISTRIYITAMRKSFILYSCRRYVFKTMVYHVIFMPMLYLRDNVSI